MSHQERPPFSPYSEAQPIFLWHPFVGPVFEKVMENLKESLSRDPREVYVVYLKLPSSLWSPVFLR